MPQESAANLNALSPLYNAAEDLLGRNLASERRDRIAFIDENGRYSFRDLAERVNRCANAFLNAGIRAGHRVALCLLDTIDFPTCFLGAIKVGIIPIPLNTMFQAADYAHVLGDAQPTAVLVSDSLLSRVQDGAMNRDRKSTRLNSSHLVISYAVFCLKKNNDHGNSCPCSSFSSVNHLAMTPLIQSAYPPQHNNSDQQDDQQAAKTV